MSDAETGAASAAGRGAWLRDRRRVNEQQENALAGDYDAQWGEIEDTHQVFVERFLTRLPPAGRILDAACGTGKYFPMVLASGRSLFGVDHAGAALAITAANFPTLRFGAVIILYLLIGAIVSISYVKWMQKRSTALQVPGGQEADRGAIRPGDSEEGEKFDGR